MDPLKRIALRFLDYYLILLIDPLLPKQILRARHRTATATTHRRRRRPRANDMERKVEFAD